MKRILLILAACACACAWAGVASARLGSLGRNDTVVTNVTDVTPGNYDTVSNAAMNARSATDLGVRGAPQGEGSWFTVNGQILAWNAGSWGDENQAIGDYGGHYLFFGENEIEFYLDENFSCSINSGTNTYIIIGYTNTLAHVSQIPTVPSASDATPLMDGDASAGTTNVWARGDHVHPSDTSKLNGGAAYPAWYDVVPYPSLWVVSYKGRLWRVKSTVEGTMGTQPDVSSDWEQVYLKDLKQDALPYPTNAIPFSAIVGAPSGGGQEWRVVDVHSFAGDTLSYVTNGMTRLYLGDYVMLSTNGWPEGAAMYVQGIKEHDAWYPAAEMRLVGYGTWPTNNFQSVWWRSGTNVYVNVILEE